MFKNNNFAFMLIKQNKVCSCVYLHEHPTIIYSVSIFDISLALIQIAT